MESCGFSCSRKTLITLNVLYIVVAFILIGVAGAGKGASIVTSIAVFGGIVACGIFLLILAIVGIYGAVRHHQVLLFFYMILLLIIFLMQFAIACGCLAINSDQQKTVVKAAWDLAIDKEYKVINLAQSNFDCCRFDLANETIPDEVTCAKLHCCTDPLAGCTTCPLCWDKMKDAINKAAKASGGLGLFFSFTEIVGILVALRYRNMRDPRADPAAFLQ